MNREQFYEQGYVSLGTKFTPGELSEIREAFQIVAQNPPPGVGVIHEDNDPNTIRSIMGWQRAGRILEQFAKDERLTAPVRQLFSNDTGFQQTKWNPKAPNGQGLEWNPHRGDVFWCYRDGVPNPTGLVSVFVALTEQTNQNGAVYVWKGSHQVTLEGIKPHILGLNELQDTARDTAADLSLKIDPEKLAWFDRTCERVMLTGEPGTVWMLHSGLLHASNGNHSDETRILVANVYRERGNDPLHPRRHHYLCEPAGNIC